MRFGGLVYLLAFFLIVTVALSIGTLIVAKNVSDNSGKIVALQQADALQAKARVVALQKANAVQTRRSS